MTWHYVGSCFDGQSFNIEGVDVWKHGWKSIDGQRVDVVDPRYGRRYNFTIYELVGGGKTVRFAAGEFSNGVWGFYRENAL